MLKIEQFVEQHFGIKLMPQQIELIAMMAASPEKHIVLTGMGRSAGKTTAYKAALAYLQDGLKPVPTAHILQRATMWALGDDTGTSSKTLCAFMLGYNETNGARGYGRSYPPCDADDRGRCIRLLKLIPEWIPRLPELAEANVGGLQDGSDKPVERSWAYQIPLIIQEGNL